MVGAAGQVLHVALVDLFGLDLDGLVFVGLQRLPPTGRGSWRSAAAATALRVSVKPAFAECSSTISIDGNRPPGKISVSDELGEAGQLERQRQAALDSSAGGQHGDGVQQHHAVGRAAML